MATSPRPSRTSTTTPTTTEALAGLRLCLLGTGAVGEALARELVCRGAEVALWSRTAGQAARVRRRIGRGAHTARSLGAALAGADGVLVCVHGDAIEEVAAAAAEAAPPSRHRRSALHTNGFRGPEVLTPLTAVGFAAGTLHPLAPVPPGARGALDGAWFATSGAPAARALARRLVRALGGRELRLKGSAEAMQVYHAAASLAAGGAVALFDAALSAFASSATEKRDARRALQSLVGRSIAHLAELEAAEALTGPASRGSEATIRAQLEALRPFGDAPADPEPLYRALLPRMLALAEARGTLTRARRRAIERGVREGR